MLSGTVRADLLNGLVVVAGLVWLWAGVAKVRWPLARTDVEALLPGWGGLQPVLRWVVPAAEIVIGVVLVTDTQARWAGFAGTLLATTFAVLHTSAMVRAALAHQPLSPGCGCFGRSHVAVAASGPGTFDVAATTARSWSVGVAAVLAMLTWLATLPCQICG